jgi:hypothetical protein
VNGTVRRLALTVSDGRSAWPAAGRLHRMTSRHAAAGGTALW